MLNFGIVHLARAYLLCAFIAQLGALQIVAAHRRWVGLSFGDYKRPVLGYTLGSLLIAGAYVWFFTSYEEIFQPGPAGAELTFLFAVAGLLAMGTTLLLAEGRRLVLEKGTEGGVQDRRSLALNSQEVSFGVSSGALFLPKETGKAHPTVCVAPGPDTEERALWQFIQELRRVGFAVLAIDYGGRFPSYPEVLALLPTAISFLRNQPGVDEERCGVLGFDLGGNAALRSASTDERIKAVVAVGPLLSRHAARPGLNILREMTYGQAISWARFREREKLITGLEAIGPRPLVATKARTVPKLLLWGEMDSLVPQSDRKAAQEANDGSLEIQIVPGETHTSLARNEEIARITVWWFVERLGHGD